MRTPADRPTDRRPHTLMSGTRPFLSAPVSPDVSVVLISFPSLLSATLLLLLSLARRGTFTFPRSKRSCRLFRTWTGRKLVPRGGSAGARVHECAISLLPHLTTSWPRQAECCPGRKDRADSAGKCERTAADSSKFRGKFVMGFSNSTSPLSLICQRQGQVPFGTVREGKRKKRW